jgi:hypothetical protein
LVVMPSMMPSGTSDSISLRLPESMKIFMSGSFQSRFPRQGPAVAPGSSS